MPLPAALVARLAKRGILDPSKASEVQNTNANEEIIAEDYDTTETRHKPDESGKTMFWGGIDGINVDPVKGHPGCPNKYNIYHECSTFCVKRWRKTASAPPDETYFENQKKVLERWPLPPGWQGVYDVGCRQHYYWNAHNGLVSWLPPSHPRARPAECAAHAREERLLREGDESDDSSDGSDQEVPQREPREEVGKERERVRESRGRRDRKRARPDNDLDPMDPAAYSDIPRGGWQDGINSTVKSGVDSTASGPLFQQRPYPAPGAVLAANARGRKPPEPPRPSRVGPQPT